MQCVLRPRPSASDVGWAHRTIGLDCYPCARALSLPPSLTNTFISLTWHHRPAPRMVYGSTPLPKAEMAGEWHFHRKIERRGCIMWSKTMVKKLSNFDQWSVINYWYSEVCSKRNDKSQFFLWNSDGQMHSWSQIDFLQSMNRKLTSELLIYFGCHFGVIFAK